MWLPFEDLEPFNRALVALEQALLAVLRRTNSLDALAESELLAEIFGYVDENPHQAVLMTRIKSGHAMTPRHAINVMLLARAWAKVAHRLGPKLSDFSLAALFHDLGHWRPDDLVYVFGPFTHGQARAMRAHVNLEDPDARVLNEDIRLWVRQHHEQPDGRGYPEGIDNPHLLSQALRIVDCFDGLTTSRRFRPPFSPHRAMTLMIRWAGYKFNAGLFKSFQKFMGKFPAGSFVLLKSGAAGVILPANEAETGCLILTNEEGDALQEPRYQEVDLQEIEGEAPRWQDLDLPGIWLHVRPDMMAMPRFYPT